MLWEMGVRPRAGQDISNFFFGGLEFLAATSPSGALFGHKVSVPYLEARGFYSSYKKRVFRVFRVFRLFLVPKHVVQLWGGRYDPGIIFFCFFGPKFITPTCSFEPIKFVWGQKENIFDKSRYCGNIP